ncbi:MAG: uroporphyrinogen-III C-methyltransferase [Acidobacteriota bacterium]
MELSRVERGKVFLVGAGPGDPELLTIKGLKCLQAADVVIYDRLAGAQILALAPRTAEKICVAKRGGHYSFPQDAINALLVAKAREGKTVVRLKGGDPFVFGRGAEEALFLANAGIPFEVVPGVSSAFAAPAAAGIPVTHRGLASTVTVIPGHQDPDSPQPVRWDLLARSADTLVVLMPLQRLRQIVATLLLNGKSFDTPAALIQSGTLPEQRQVIGTLRTIEELASAAGLTSPAVLVVGAVVTLSAKLGQAPVAEKGRGCASRSVRSSAFERCSAVRS